MGKLQGVPDTPYIPLTARIYVSERFPTFFCDEDALSPEAEPPDDRIAMKMVDEGGRRGVYPAL